MDKFKAGDKVTVGRREGKVDSGPWVNKLYRGPAYQVWFADHDIVELVHQNSLDPVEQWESVYVDMGEVKITLADGTTEHRRNVQELKVRMK